MVYSNNSPQTDGAEATEKKSAVRDPMVWATFGLLLVTAASAVVLFLQYGTLDKTDATLKETLAANKIAQRAFVGPAGYPIYSAIPAQGNEALSPTRLNPAWKNTGTTPTRDLHFYTLCDQRSYEHLDPWPTNRPLRLLVPQQTELGSPCDISPARITQMSAHVAYFIVAKAEYKDVFSDAQRVTEACWLVNVRSETFTNIRLSFDACPIHNCADDDCKR